MAMIDGSNLAILSGLMLWIRFRAIWQIELLPAFVGADHRA
jgi:hypothetical protein